MQIKIIEIQAVVFFTDTKFRFVLGYDKRNSDRWKLYSKVQDWNSGVNIKLKF